jgi:hypothetical protein
MIPSKAGDSMRMAPPLAVSTRSSREAPHRADADVIDAQPSAMRGALIAMFLVFPFWAAVVAAVVRLASGH